MNEIVYGYICTYNGKRVEIRTTKGMFDAQVQAKQEFQKTSRKKINNWDVNVFLAEKDGQPVVHTADF